MTNKEIQERKELEDHFLRENIVTAHKKKSRADVLVYIGILIAVLVFMFIFSCNMPARMQNDSGFQYYIDENNYPLIITGVHKGNKNFLYHCKNYSYAIHLKDTFHVGDTLIIVKK